MATSNKAQTTLTLSGDREIVITCVFDAPRALVFQAYTDPAAIPQWWGPAKYQATVEQMDVRVGGAWRFLHVGPDGEKYAFHGEYREVVPPEKLVYTFEFEGFPGHVSVETITLEERDGKTYVQDITSFDNAADRDGMIQSGMEGGMREAQERLVEYLATRTA